MSTSLGQRSDEEYTPIFEKERDPTGLEQETFKAKTQSKRKTTLSVKSLLHWSCHVLFAFLLLLLFEEKYLAKDEDKPHIMPAEKPFSDIHSILEYENVIMEPHDAYGKKDESWIGPPDALNRRKWWDLTHVGVVSITDEEQLSFNMKTSRANKTGEYFLVPQVYHDLHCLKKMREAFWSIDVKHSLDAKSRKHMDHCIDLIRRSLMCSADLSPYPFHWGGDKHRADYNIERRCRKWEHIQSWALRRNTTGYVL